MKKDPRNFRGFFYGIIRDTIFVYLVRHFEQHEKINTSMLPGTGMPVRKRIKGTSC